MTSLDNLSQFSSIVLRLDADWSYDPLSGRYRGKNGRFLSVKAVEALVDGRISKLDATLKRLTRSLIDGSITIDQWQNSVREALKSAHIQATIVGHGGRDGMGNAEYGRIGQRLRQEYSYLQNFARDILERRVSGAQAIARIGLYAQSVRGTYWEGLSIRRSKEGYSLMRRILDNQAQHCQDCLSYSLRGAVPIGSVPLPGQRCACRARCKCTIQYYRQQFPSIVV